MKETIIQHQGKIKESIPARPQKLELKLVEKKSHVSPTEENFILISTRVRDTPFKKKLDSLDVGISVKLTAPLGIC